MNDLFAHSPDATIIIQCHPDRRIVHACSSAFHCMTGYTSDELLGLDLASLPAHGAKPLWLLIGRLCDFISPDTREAFAESYFTLPHLEPQFGELYAKCMSDSTGAFMMLTIRDRSERKWIEDQLLEHSVIASLLLTTARTVIAIRKYHTPFLYDRLELSQTNVDQFIDERDRARVLDQLEDLRHSGETGEFRFILQLFEDRYHAYSIIKPFYNGDRSFRCYAIVLLEMVPVEGTSTAANTDSRAATAPALQELLPDAVQTDSGEDQSDPSYKLRLLMLEKRMSVTKLAEKTKISLTTISNIRNGKIKKPQRLTAKLIADELGVSVNELWGPYH